MRCVYFFSFRSPYSWIASRLLFNATSEAERIELVPFWEPDDESARLLRERGGDFPYRPMSDAKHRYILQDIRRLASHLSISMRWPVDERPWWDLSHLAYLKAVELGCGQAFFWGVYRARWEEGRDISDPKVIASLCEELGLDAEAIANAHADPAIRARGADCLYRIYEGDVFGVPYFMYRRERFWGVDRLPLFLRKLSNCGKGGTEADAADGPAFIYDTDHAGGCG